MGSSDDPRASIENAIRRALALINKHPEIEKVGSPHTDENGVVTVSVSFAVNLPNECKKQGKSLSGVGIQEEVLFTFPKEFPLIPPKFSLRRDFNRNLPHMQPWLENGSPVPCIYDGDLSELLHQNGLVGILNQITVWLNRAASGILIDPDQGWEPVRRDSYNSVLVADAGLLQRLVDRRGGFRFMDLRYLKFPASDDSHIIHGQILNKMIMVNYQRVSSLFSECRAGKKLQLHVGKSLALVVWPGRDSSGKLIINDTYFPETVDSIDSLRERAKLYGCRKELDGALDCLKGNVSGWECKASYAMAVIFLVRRPYQIIGSESCIEICPYVVKVEVPQLFADGGATIVCAAAHRQAISRNILARMSGLETNTEKKSWTLVGAGSLGSKLALHLARTGNSPSVVVDNSNMSPHNASRHALVPVSGELQISWSDAKAKILSKTLHGLDQTATPIASDVIRMLMSEQGVRRVCPKKAWAVVNATASLTVREAFGASKIMSTRVIETSLFAHGKVGLITTEGADRNPCTTDLIAEFYAILKDCPDLQLMVFDDDAVSRQSIGQGCGSMTMTMTDGRISLFAAGMSEYLLYKQQGKLQNESGEILIGKLTEDKIGLTWNTYQIPPVTVVSTANGENWRVHIHARALAKIQKEVSCHPDVETGGVIVGRLSEVSRVAHVVDVVEAPIDSVRSSDKFVLGTEGLSYCLRKYSESSNWLLYCLGTWHNHLSAGGPSVTDKETAKIMELARLTPSILLITTPTEFHALAVYSS